ncbi:MAG TPA: HAMP domain-containing sensor histidine kinase [Calidithermus sp.]|nr:HAMP domain-containing sensor histidine kinase [Calidithermus sp.]
MVARLGPRLPYALAPVAVGFALALNLLLWPLIQPSSSPLFFAAVAVVSWFGGLGPGLVATVLATAAGEYFFVPPAFRLGLDLGTVLRMLMFAAAAVLTSLLNQAARSRRQQAEELARVRGELLRQAEAVSRAKDEFLGTLSHELRTPLNAVLGWLARLQEGGLDPDTRARAVDVARRNAEALRRLIDELLDLSEVAAGRMAIERAPVALAACLEAAVARHRAAARERRITVHTLLDPHVRVRGDARRLTQVVDHLLDHALRSTPDKGQVELRLERGGERAWIVVRDGGPGTPAARLATLFDPFPVTGDPPTAGGLALGLAIARHLIEAHGGTVRAESEGEGRGTTFTVELPLDDGNR